MKKDNRYMQSDSPISANGAELKPLQFRMIVRTSDGKRYRSPWQMMDKNQAEHGASFGWDHKENFNISVEHRGHDMIVFGKNICSIEFEERGRAD